jgi:hypothetical protein
MRLACCALASLLAACEPAPPPAPPKPKVAYYQEYMVTGDAPGFKLAQPIEPANADPKRFFWFATYDAEGRVVTLETYAPPMCLQSRLNLFYTDKNHSPARRQRIPANDCKPAKTF